MLHPALKSARSRRLPEHGLAEAVALAAALPELDVQGSEVVRLSRVHPGTLLGSGKVAELKDRFHDLKIDLIAITSIPGTILKHRLRLLAGNGWELRDVSAA